MNIKIVVAIVIVLIIIAAATYYIMTRPVKSPNAGGTHGQNAGPGYNKRNSVTPTNPIIEPVFMVTPTPPPTAVPPTDPTYPIVATNAGSAVGVFASNAYPIMEARSFIGLLSDGTLVELVSDAIMWVALYRGIEILSPVTFSTNNTVNVPGYQVTTNYPCMPQQTTTALVTQNSLPGLLDFTKLASNSYSILGYQYTHAYSRGGNTTVDIGAPVIPSVSGDCIVSGNYIIAVTTEGSYIKVYYNSGTTPIVYYYLFTETTLGGAGISIIQVALDSSCNIFVLLSNGQCGCVNTTYTPTLFQNGMLTLIDSYANIQSITIDKTNDILYGLSTGGNIYFVNKLTGLKWSAPPVTIPSYYGFYGFKTVNSVSATPSTIRLISIYSSVGYSAQNITIPAITLPPQISNSTDPGNILISETSPSPTNFNIAIATSDYIYLYVDSVWVAWIPIPAKHSIVKAINYAGHNTIYSTTNNNGDSNYFINQYNFSAKTPKAFAPIKSMIPPAGTDIVVTGYDFTTSYLRPNVLFAAYTSSVASDISIKPMLFNNALLTVRTGEWYRTVAQQPYDIVMDTSLNMIFIANNTVNLANYINDNTSLSSKVMSLPSGAPAPHPSCRMAIDKQNGIVYYMDTTAPAGFNFMYANASTITSGSVPSFIPVTAAMCPALVSSTLPALANILSISCINPIY